MRFLKGFKKKYLIKRIFIIMSFIIIIISRPIFADHFNSEWKFQNEMVEMVLSYSEAHDQVRLEVRLKDKAEVEEYKLNYHLQNKQDKKPQFLISGNGKDYFIKNNFKINLNQNNKTVQYWFKLKEDISYRAGSYQFKFQPSSGLQKCSIIPINLKLKKLTRIMVGSPRVNIKMNAGPGGYELKKPIQVKVKTNYPEWSLEVIGNPLIYKDEDKIVNSNEKEKNMIPLNRIKLIYDKNEIFLNRDSIIIDSVNNQYSKKYFLNLKINLTWKDQAGQYEKGGLKFRVTN